MKKKPAGLRKGRILRHIQITLAALSFFLLICYLSCPFILNFIAGEDIYEADCSWTQGYYEEHMANGAEYPNLCKDWMSFKGLLLCIFLILLATAVLAEAILEKTGVL